MDRRHAGDRRPGSGTGKLVVALLALGLALAPGAVARADGAETFGPKTDYATGVGSAGVAAYADPQTGRPDLAVVNQHQDGVNVLRGNADGTFAPQVTYAEGSCANAVTTFTDAATRQPDLAIANYCNPTVSVLRGNADGATPTGPSPPR